MNRTACQLALFVLWSGVVMSQNPQGFFLDDFESRTLTIPRSVAAEKPSKPNTVTVTIDFTGVVTPVSKYVFGNNANIWMTQMVDQPTLINNLSLLKPNIIRFPGGSLSGVYFWDAPKGQPPADAPTQIPDAAGAMQNAGYWYGKNTESWTLSLENYYKMLQMTGNTGMITVNYDYARYSTANDPVASAAHLAANWVRYDNGRTKFWEVGNESNGTWQPAFRINPLANKDGQPLVMSGQLYGTHFKIFADSMAKAAADIDKTIYIGAQLLEKPIESWQNDTDRYWNEGVFQHAGNTPDFYIIHSYYTAYHTNANAAEILTTATEGTGKMMTFVNQAMTAAGVTPKPLAMTEYNIFSTGSKQQASFINGMHGTIVMAEAIKNKYGMVARWDLANAWDDGNDHGMFSQGDDGTPKWTPRAVFYYQYYFQKYFGDRLLGSSVVGSNDVLAYGSAFGSGESGIVLINKGTTEQIANISMDNFGYGDNYYVYSLTGGTDNGEFSLKVSVNGNPPTQSVGGPTYFESIDAWSCRIQGGIKVRLPARSVQYVLVEDGSNVITATADVADTMHVYPNPANGNFTLDFSPTDECRLSIIDLNGREVFVKIIYPDQQTTTIESKLPPGIYVVRTKGKSKTSYARIVIK